MDQKEERKWLLPKHISGIKGWRPNGLERYVPHECHWLQFVLRQRPKTLKSTFEMVLEIKCSMVNHFKWIQHVFLVLDGRKCWMKNLFWSSNTIQHDFFLLLGIVWWIRRVETDPTFRPTLQISYVGWNFGPA